LIVALVLLADPRTGGWITYTAHLAKGLIAAGYQPIIIRPGNKSEKKPRPFALGLDYWNTSIPDIIHLAANNHTIITAIGKNYREHLPALLEHKPTIVIHDPTELDSDVRETIKGHDIITIRQIISDKLENAGIPNRYVPHPYERAPGTETQRTGNTSAFSRIDWDKRTELLVKANLLLPEDKQIAIYGTLNSQYEFHKLKPADPNWRRNYRGSWSPREPIFYPVILARQAKQTIDLSVIAGDGGGTQYSFLEAFDGGSPLIIHSDWLTGNPKYDEIAPAIAGHGSTPEQITDLVLNPPQACSEAIQQILQTHDAKAVAEQTLAR
jgi:hypothetical protein